MWNLIFSGVVTQQSLSNYLVYETFTEDDGVFLGDGTANTHAPEIDVVGNGWQDFGPYDFYTRWNAAVILSSGDSNAYIDCGQTDQWVETDIRVPSGNGHTPGLAVRFQDGSNYWVVQVDPDGSLIYINEKVTGGYTQRGSNSFTWNNGETHNLKAKMTGTTIEGWADDGSKVSYASATNFSSATNIGIKANRNYNYSNFEYFYAYAKEPADWPS